MDPYSQAKGQYKASGLSKEQKDSLMSELLSQKMSLDESLDVVNYTQDEINSLEIVTESTKRILMDITSKSPSC